MLTHRIQTWIQVKAESVLTQLLFEHSLKIRLKAEVQDVDVDTSGHAIQASNVSEATIAVDDEIGTDGDGGTEGGGEGGSESLREASSTTLASSSSSIKSTSSLLISDLSGSFQTHEAQGNLWKDKAASLLSRLFTCWLA